MSPNNDCATCHGSGFVQDSNGPRFRCDCQFKCLACRDSGSVRVGEGRDRHSEECRCQAEKRIKERLLTIPARFRDSSFATYLPRNSDQEKTLQAMKENPTDSLFLVGDYGTGKTHLLYAQYHELITYEWNAVMRTAREFFDERQKIDTGKGGFDCDLLREKDLPHLLIDDLDKCKISEYRAEAFFQVIDHYYAREGSLTLTCNRGLAELQAIGIPPAAIRRIDEMCKVLKV